MQLEAADRKCYVIRAHNYIDEKRTLHAVGRSRASLKMPMYLLVGALLLATWTKSVAADDFQNARVAIDNAKPNINYTAFCETVNEGEDKIACRIRSVMTVGFLVCKQPQLEEEECSQVINTELTNLVQLATAGVHTVTVSQPQIDDVMCGDPEANSTNCSGFLEEWVVNGQFQQIRDHIVSGTVEDLINQVKEFTNETGWQTTANDLTTIESYMRNNPNENQYRQICDLQGFFLQSGGFLVSDVPVIDMTIGINGMCYPGEPTTEQVLTALEQMINALGEDVGLVAVTDSGRENTVMYLCDCWVLCLALVYLTVGHAIVQL